MTKRNASWVALALAAAACGGGGSTPPVDHGNAITLSFDRATLTQTSYYNQFYREGLPEIALYGEASWVPTTAVYVFLVETGDPVFAWNAVRLVSTGRTTFTAYFEADPYLTVGTYTGTLEIVLCHDSACAQPYDVSAPVLSYEIVVKPQMYVQVIANGYPLFSISPMDRFEVAGLSSGDLLELVSSGDATWSWSAPSGAAVTRDPSSTATHWIGTVTGASGQAISFTGSALDGTIQTDVFGVSIL